MELNIEMPKVNGKANGDVLINKESRSIKTSSFHNGHVSIFDPNKYMLKLPKTKKVTLPNGQVRFEKTETDYLPVAARIAWFRKDHPLWSIVTEVEQLADKAETGAIGRALAMCGYGTLQAPEFDEQDRLADAPIEKSKPIN